MRQTLMTVVYYDPIVREVLGTRGCRSLALVGASKIESLVPKFIKPDTKAAQTPKPREKNTRKTQHPQP